MGYAYSVSVKLSVANLASQGLRLIAADMLKAHGIASNLQTKLSALKLAAVGYGLSRAGVGIFHGLEATVSASKEYTSQLSLMNAAGMSHAEIVNSIGAAWSTSHQVLTSTAASNLRQLRELRSLFGDQHMGEAFSVLPAVMRAQATMEALTGHKNERIGFEMAKVAELRQTGVMTLPFLQRNIEQLSRTLYAMGGTINANDFLMTMKYAKTAALTFSDRFVYRELPTLIQEMKSAGGGMMGNASTAGTALATLYGSIVQGKIPKSAIPLWESLGLVKVSDIVRNATGSFQIRPGAIEGAKLFQTDPFRWAQMVAPQLERYAKMHHLNMTQIAMSMFGARNSQFMMNTLISKAAQIQRDSLLIGTTPNNLAIYQSLLKSNPMLADQALHAQWQNVLSIIGYQVMPKLVPLMVSFANDLNSLAGWIQRHPKITEGIVISLGALSAGLAVLGNVLMTRAVLNFTGLGPLIAKGFTAALPLIMNPVGATIAAIVGIGAAAYLLYRNWDSVRPFLLGVWHGIEADTLKAWSGIRTDMGELTDWMRHEWDDLTQWFHRSPASASLAPSRAAQDWASSGGSPAAARYIVMRPPATTVIPVQLNVDGKKVAAVTVRHIADELGKPQTGTSIFDGRQALVPAGGL